MQWIRLDQSDGMKNKDLVPMPPSRRSWGIMAYIWYWGMCSLCASTWSQGSSLEALGLNGNHSMGIVVIANVIISIVSVVCGYFGARYHIGYSVFQRVIFGVRGSCLGVLIRSILSVVWCASQAWLGGLCVNVVICSWSKSYLEWENTFPDSVPMTNQELCGFVIYMGITIPTILSKPEKLDWLLAAGSICVFFMGIGITCWAVHENDGHYGSLMSAEMTLSSSDLGWAWIYALSIWYSSLTAGISNQCDYSRFNKSPVLSSLGIMIGNQVLGFVIPLLGILSASAIYEQRQEYYWMPNDICMMWLEDNYSPKARAGAFFCGLALVVSQLGINSVGNAISGGMDLASLFPRYINIRRGAIICLLLSWPTQPWLFYNADSVFLTVMSSFSVFVTPLIAVFICDFYVVRKRIIKLTDCYINSKDSIYWFELGVNWRSIASLLIGMAPGLPGLINAANPSISLNTGGMRLYQGSFIFQFLVGFTAHYLINLVFKVKVGEEDSIDYFGTYTAEECKRYKIAPQSTEKADDPNVELVSKLTATTEVVEMPSDSSS